MFITFLSLKCDFFILFKPFEDQKPQKGYFGKPKNKYFGKAVSGILANPKMGTLANSKDPDEMPLDAAFHQGLHCLV